MLSKKNLYWFAQVFGWLVYIFIAGFYNILNHKEISKELIISLLSIYLIGISISHLYRLAIIKLNLLGRNIVLLVPKIIVGTVIFGVIVYVIQTIVLDIVIAQNKFEFSFADAFPKIINWTLLGLLWSLFYFLFHFVNNYKKEEIKNLKWQATKNEIELNRLKSQLNPHFIFNAMNSIRALVEEDPIQAKNAITQLSNVLRNSLMMGKKKLIPLGEEMKLVNDYLSLEKTRFEEKLIIQLNIDLATETFLVPPLMIQTLVENGIKHGTSKLPKGGTLAINASIIDNKLQITIFNSGIYNENQTPKTGYGIINTKQRLQLLYGNQALFEIKNKNNRVETTLLIPKQILV